MLQDLAMCRGGEVQDAINVKYLLSCPHALVCIIAHSRLFTMCSNMSIMAGCNTKCSEQGNWCKEIHCVTDACDKPAPLPMLSQVADDSVPPQHDNAAAHLSGEMEATQLHKHHATAQPPRAAATAQP